MKYNDQSNRELISPANISIGNLSKFSKGKKKKKKNFGVNKQLNIFKPGSQSIKPMLQL